MPKFIIISSFTHKIEKFSPIELILERLKEAKHHFPEELSQTAFLDLIQF